MILDGESSILNGYMAEQREHHLFSISASSESDSIHFDMIYTNIMHVDRLFVKAFESNGEFFSFECFGVEDNCEAIDWIENICDDYFHGDEYHIEPGKK
jgi:hypothetical protein